MLLHLLTFPEGGGQTTTITVNVDDKHGNPVEDANVSFSAEAFEAGERNGQLSQRETTTDQSGQARTTYTTLASDDHRFVSIIIAASKDNTMEFRTLTMVAADNAAKVSGVVKDPFTGQPMEDVNIHFWRGDLNRSIGFVGTDSEGYYSATVPTATYSMSFDMERRDSITANITNPGGSYTINNEKGVLKGVVSGVSPSEEVMAIGPGFNRNDPSNWTLIGEIQNDGSFTIVLSPNTYELVIMGRVNPFKTGVTVESGKVTDIGNVSAQ